VEAAVEGSNSVPARAVLVVVVQFVNDRSPTVTVDTLTDSGQARVMADTPPGTFVAHISASDPNRGDNGRVTCLLNSYDDDYLLVRMFDGEYKMLTRRSLDAVGVIDVSVKCHDHGDPPRSTLTNISVTVYPAHGANIPVFSQPVYNATLSIASRTPAFVIRVTAAAPNSSSDGNISYSFAESYPTFSIGRSNGVVRMVVSPVEATTVELVVVATAVGGGSSRATAYLSVVRPEQISFYKNALVCHVRENYEIGTSVCSLAEAGPFLTADKCLYYDLLDSADKKFYVDPITGTIYTNVTLDREVTPQFRLTARVQLDTTPTRVLDVLIDVNIEDANDCAPVFIFPSSANNTVIVNTTAMSVSTSGTLLVAVVSARDGDESKNGRVTYSLIANSNDSRYFVMAPSTGEVRLNVDDPLDHLINRSLVLYVTATDQGRPPLQTVAVLYIILRADVATSSKQSELQSDSGLTILAGVLSSFVVVALVIGIAIFIVCRKSRRQKPISADLFWGRVLQIESSEEIQATPSVLAIGPKPAVTDVDKPLHISTADADTGVDYLQRYQVCTPNIDRCANSLVFTVSTD